MVLFSVPFYLFARVCASVATSNVNE